MDEQRDPFVRLGFAAALEQGDVEFVAHQLEQVPEQTLKAALHQTDTGACYQDARGAYRHWRPLHRAIASTPDKSRII
jgi:hypothetical protein